MDYTLKADSELALNAALLDAGVTINVLDVEGNVVRAAVQSGFNLDIIGTIYRPTGAVIVEDGIERPDMAALPGFHANLRCEPLAPEAEAKLPSIAAPNNPARVWA